RRPPKTCSCRIPIWVDEPGNARRRENSFARRVPNEMGCAPAATRVHSASGHQFQEHFPSERGSGHYFSATGRMVDGVALHSSTKAAETRQSLWMAALPQQMDSPEPWQHAAVGGEERCLAPIRRDSVRTR